MEKYLVHMEKYSSGWRDLIRNQAGQCELMRGFESHLLRLKIKYAGMVESADTADSKSAEAIRKGSSPFTSTNYGEVLKWLKRLPWKGSRSLIAARGFKSLPLRSIGM